MSLLGKDNNIDLNQNDYEKLIIEIGNGRYMDTYDTYTTLLSFFIKYTLNSLLTSSDIKDNLVIPRDKVIEMLHLIKNSVNIAVNYVIVESAVAAQLSKLTLSLATRLKRIQEDEINFASLLTALYSAFLDILREYEDLIRIQCSNITDYTKPNMTLVIPPGRYLNACISAWEKTIPMVILRHRHLKHPHKPRGKPAFLPSLPYLRGKAESIVVESVLVTSDRALTPPGTNAAVKELNPKNIIIIAIPLSLTQTSSLTTKNIRPVVEYMMENGEIINAFSREILELSQYNVFILTGKNVLTRSAKSSLAAKILSTSKEWSQEFTTKVIEKYLSYTDN